jgi:hypothetical protein
MKYFIFSVLVLAITGCSSPIIKQEPHNAIIPLGSADVGIFIPESWETIKNPANGKNIVLMAQNGSDNVVVSFEYSNKIITGEALSNGAKTGFARFSETFVDETQCFFVGHLAANTPLRNFWQKIIRTPESANFLLVSCSSEQLNAPNSQCPEILKSFKILDKKE